MLHNEDSKLFKQTLLYKVQCEKSYLNNLFQSNVTLFYQNEYVFGNMWILIINYMGFLVYTNFPFFSWLLYSDYPHNLQSPNQSETTELNLFSSKAIVFGPMLPKQMLCFWNVQVGEYEIQYSGSIT